MNKQEFPKPSITGDVIVYDWQKNKILLLKRKNEPYKDCWAIVGGFFNAEAHHGEEMDQSIRDAAIRELKEEVNIDFYSDRLFSRYDFNFLTVQDKPGRDTRGRVVTLVYVLTIWDGIEDIDIKAQDDAAEVRWFDMGDIMRGDLPLAFDHFDSIQKFARGTKYV